jgi:hypothetical protein
MQLIAGVGEFKPVAPFPPMDKQNPVDSGNQSAQSHRAKRGYKKLNLKVANHLVGDLLKAGVLAVKYAETHNTATGFGKVVAKDLRSALLRLLDVRAEYTSKGLEARKILGADDRAGLRKKKLQARIAKLQAQLSKIK